MKMEKIGRRHITEVESRRLADVLDVGDKEERENKNGCLFSACTSG